MQTETLLQADIRKALNEVLATRSFSNSAILSGFLRHVVEKTLAGQSAEIKEYTVGTEALGKPFSFNPLHDASVRIHAVRLRKLLNEYYAGAGAYATLQISLPKGSYIPVFISPVSGALSPDAGSQAAAESTVTANARGIEDSICIVPFTGFMQYDSMDFSVEGFCEFLTEKLSLFQDITVISFRSANEYLAAGGELAHLGKALGVNYYLAGSIEILENYMRVSAHLFDADSNTLLWSHDFSASMEAGSLLHIIEEITVQIVSSLAGYSGFLHFKKFDSTGPQPVFSNKSANAVFWFYHFLTRDSEEIYHQAVRHLEISVKEDPTCALCWAVLAHLYAHGIIYNYKTVPDPLAKAQEYVARAIALDTRCQQAHLTLAWINIILRNREKALQHLEISDSINPNSSYFKAAASLGMAFLGEYARSQELLNRAVLLNPLPLWWMSLPSIFQEIKKRDFRKVLFHARKMGTPARIYEHVFEIIALHELNDLQALKKLSATYLKKYPQGLEHALKALPAIIFDQELVDQITGALQQIIKITREANENGQPDEAGDS